MLYFSHNIEDYPEGIVLPVDKPYRWTSADVIRKVKYLACKHFAKKNLKVGHAGTLDPLATGILLVCIGPATRRAEELQRSPKQYLAGVTFGAVTASYDLEKEIERFCPLDGVNEQSVRELLPHFIGEQEQIAPLFSAKSVDGVRMYETARKLLREAREQGREFDPGDLLQSSLINVYNIELERFIPSERLQEALPLIREENSRNARINVADLSSCALPTAMLRIDCSKGTYIRALARDIGESLGSGAFLSSLRRTQNGGYTIADAVSMDDVVAAFSQRAVD